MKKETMALGLVGVLVLAGSLGYFLIGRQPTSDMKSAPENIAAHTPTPSTTENMLRAGGSSYRDSAGVYVFLYPSDYTLDNQGNGQYIRIYKAGETQKGQTEMYDGVIMVFETIKLEGQSLEKWLDARIKDATADGTTEILKPKAATMVNNYSGFSYSTRSLGTADYLVIQSNPTSGYAVSITTSISDPQLKNYQEEVDAILSTVELLK